MSQYHHGYDPGPPPKPGHTPHERHEDITQGRVLVQLDRIADALDHKSQRALPTILDRIADALEKIADALPKPPPIHYATGLYLTYHIAPKNNPSLPTTQPTQGPTMSVSIPLSTTEKVTVTSTPNGNIDSVIQWRLLSGTAVATPAADGFSCEFVNDNQDSSEFEVSTTANGVPLTDSVTIRPSEGGTGGEWATDLGLVAGTPVPR